MRLDTEEQEWLDRFVVELSRRFPEAVDRVIVFGSKARGDADSDMELGRRTGLRTILVLTGRGRDQLERIRSLGLPAPWRIAEDIVQAVSMIEEDR